MDGGRSYSDAWQAKDRLLVPKVVGRFLHLKIRCKWIGNCHFSGNLEAVTIRQNVITRRLFQGLLGECRRDLRTSGSIINADTSHAITHVFYQMSIYFVSKMQDRNLENYFGMSGKVVLVTGATKGIGLAMVDAFAAAGASLVIASNDRVKCEAIAARLGQENVEALGVACDVSQPEELENLVFLALRRFGQIDVLICNAGVQGPSGPMHSATEAEVDALFQVNLHHPRRLTALVAPHMAERRTGSIILTSSIAGLRGNKSIGLYAMSKAALSQLARNLAVEFGPKNVRANAIAPGLISTEWISAVASSPEALQRRLSLTPLRRAGEPWEIAAGALFLASPGSAFITGQTLVVDGGTIITDGN
jgi:NAD(P)-dependent dehydrogenase (short-subunit alcohol dehydrogenase family)